jgi:adenylate cyclase
MLFRIGVHLGDVTKESGRVYGDGVNIAARLESLAEPGGICISRTIHEQVRNKLDLLYEDLGEQHLKNIPDPVQAYRVRSGPAEAISPERLPGMEDLTVPGFGGRPAIAVLPFDNLSGDPEQEYFADGIAEDLITRLSAWRDFPVIARNSSFVYKGGAVDVKEVSAKLGVRYVVEGSVRRAGDHVRISAQLIDATSGHHVWAERYDRELSNIFALQDEITESIVASMHPELRRTERDRSMRQEPANLDAWDWIQRGDWHFHQLSREANVKARSCFEKAIELDASSATAYADLALTHYADLSQQWTEAPTRSAEDLMRAARRSVTLDDKNSHAQVALSYAYRTKGRWDNAMAAIERAVQLNPSLAEGCRNLGITLALTGRSEEAIANLDKAIRLNPHDPVVWISLLGMALAQFGAGRYADAMTWTWRALEQNSDLPVGHAILAAVHVQLEQMDQAKLALQELLRLNPDYSLTGLRALFSEASTPLIESFLDALRKAGLKE